MRASRPINASESAREKNQLCSTGITLDFPQTSSRAKDGKYIYDGEESCEGKRISRVTENQMWCPTNVSHAALTTRYTCTRTHTHTHFNAAVLGTSKVYGGQGVRRLSVSAGSVPFELADLVWHKFLCPLRSAHSLVCLMIKWDNEGGRIDKLWSSSYM